MNCIVSLPYVFKDYVLRITSEEKKIKYVNIIKRDFFSFEKKMKQVSRREKEKKRKMFVVPEIRTHARQTRFRIISSVLCQF